MLERPARGGLLALGGAGLDSDGPAMSGGVFRSQWSLPCVMSVFMGSCLVTTSLKLTWTHRLVNGVDFDGVSFDSATAARPTVKSSAKDSLPYIVSVFLSRTS